MADLDDFFAKKDRKKSKPKKFTTPEDLVKKVEEPAPKKVEPKPRKEPQQQPQQAVVGPEGTEEEQPQYEEVHEDEWKEFEVEERKDYSGLKIGQLQINDDDQSGSDGDRDDDGEGDGTENSEKRKAGPWRKMQGGGEAAAANPTVVANTSEKTQEKPNTSKLYVSPALRNQSLKPIHLRKGVLPDIHNEEYFPTLGSVKPEDIKKKQKEPAFEEVKHGGRYQRSSDLSSSAPVAVENRYNSLADS